MYTTAIQKNYNLIFILEYLDYNLFNIKIR